MFRALRFGPAWMLIAGGILLCSTLRVSADYPTSVLDDDPRGYWRLNDGPGSKTAKNIGLELAAWTAKVPAGDWMASGPTELVDGTKLHGMGVSPGALYLGASDMYLTVDQPLLSDLSQFTVSCWIRSQPWESDRVELWGQEGVIELGFTQPNRLELWTARGGVLTWDFNPELILSAEGWTLLSATGDGNQLRLFVNAQPVATGGTPVVDHYGSNHAAFRVSGGKVFDPEANQFPGLVSELAVWDQALPAQRLEAHLRSAISANALGDFDGDTLIGLTDVNMLIDAILEGSTDTLYDVDRSDIVDAFDLYHWVNIIKDTWVGDADLDGQFNSADFVQVFQRGEYEDTLPDNSGWDDGDWDADADFTSADFVAAFVDGGYEEKSRAAPAVPEPTSGWLLPAAVAWMRVRRRVAFP